MAKIDVAATIQETSDLLEQKDKLMEQVADNRYLLRAAVRSGDCSAEQEEWIKETFPEQKTKTAEERVAAAEQRLAEVREKAEKAEQGNSKKGSRSRAAA